jgi:polysaccharide export outer membrane protein
VPPNFISASLAACLLLSACAPGSDLPPLPAASTSDYTLGSGDRLRIITYGEDQLTGDFTVNDSGTIEVPLLGSVAAKGRTVTELQSALIEELTQRGLLRKPSVSVEISTYRPIFVLGEVTKPGQYPYQPNMTVITAAAVAGGFTYRAVKSRAAVTRTDDGKAITGQADPETRLQPGDVVNILERSF